MCIRLDYFEEYESLVLTYLEDPAMNAVIRKLLNSLIERNVLQVSNFKKIPSYMIDPAVSGPYYDLFAKKNNNKVLNTDFSILEYTFNLNKDETNLNIYKEMKKFNLNSFLSFIYQNDPETTKQSMKMFFEKIFMKNEDQLVMFMMILTELSVKNVLYYDPENIV